MDKRFWGILAAIAVLLTGILVLTNHNKASAPSNTSATSGTLTNHVEGGGKSGITLIEYGDYQCPACGQYYPIVKEAVKQHTEQIKFQFRNFPLYQIHQNAMAGARAAEAADLQGKYWEMHDLLYENQQGWSTSSNPQTQFNSYAQQLGLNVEKFKTDYKSKEANDRIQADLKEGNRLKVDSTPSFFIWDGGKDDPKKISNPQSLDAFNKVLDAAIQQKTGKAPAAGSGSIGTEAAGSAATASPTEPAAAPAQ